MRTIKNIKGFVNTNKGKVTITTSVFAGEREEESKKILDNIIKGFENFGFVQSQQEKKGDWQNYYLTIDNLSEDIYDQLSNIDFKETFKRVEILLSKNNDTYEILKIKSIPKKDSEETSLDIFTLFEEEPQVAEKLGKLWMFVKSDETKSFKLTFSPLEENKEEIEELLNLGFSIEEKNSYTPANRVNIFKFVNESIVATDVIEKLEKEEKSSIFGTIQYIYTNYGIIKNIVDIKAWEKNSNENSSTNTSNKKDNEEEHEVDNNYDISDDEIPF